MKFLEWIYSNATVPNLLLTLLLGLGLVVMISATHISHFRLGDMIMDENGKASSSRISMFIALGLSSYMLAYLTINSRVNDETLFYVYAVYLITWAGSKTLDKFVSAWSSNRNGGRVEDRGTRREETRGSVYSHQGVDSDPNPPTPRRYPERSASEDPVPYMRGRSK